MVTKEEMKRFENLKKTEVKSSYKVSAEELSHFRTNEIELADILADRKKQYEKENNVSATTAYLDIEEKCMIKMDTFKKVMCGQRKITRKLLYKFVVGFGMTIEEANEYFILCGGPLNPDYDQEDYICFRALEDRDSVHQLVADFEKHLSLKI